MFSYFHKLRRYFSDTIWSIDIDVKNTKSPKIHKTYIQSLRISYLIVRDTFFDSQLNLRAMSLVYTTLLSLVPLLAVSVSVLKGFGADHEISSLLEDFLLPLGDRGADITAQIINFVEGINYGLLGSLGLALLIYTVISLMQKIEHAFNFTWHVSEDRSFARRFSDYLSVILIGPVLIFTALGITASLTSSILYQKLLSYPVIGIMFGSFSHVLPFVLIILAFTLIYIFIPNTKVKFKAAFIGAVIAGILWQTVGWVFASFVSSANYNEIYSAFAALFFFLIWLYLCWFILLVGASIAFYLQNPEQCSPSARGLILSNRMKEKLSLAIMSQVATQFHWKKPPLTLQQLAKNMKVTTEPVLTIVNSLLGRNLLIKTEHEPTTYVPGSAPETITALDIITAVRTAEEDNLINLERLPNFSKVNDAFMNYQEVASDVLSRVLLTDLVLDDVENDNNE